MGSRRLLLRLAAIAVAAAALVPIARVAPSAAVVPPPPAGLPTHLGIGLSAHPDDTGVYGWMPNSGIPFDYSYQYLAGGVNTGNGWATWNTSGQFPLWYAQGAASHNYVPVFPYDQLLQSNGPCGGCGEAQRDLANLNAPATTSAYFSDFTLLMKRLGNKTWDNIAGFGKTAVVHVEPDLSGYAEQAVLDNGGSCYGFCTGQGNDASLLKASVASSGVTDVAAYANTYRGFSQALMHLRDVYAPNVLLAFHVSNWAPLQDIGSSTDASLDPAALGRQAGSFATSAGAGSYDLVFNDVADRDAGYYKYVYGSQNVFWDRQNIKLPNFVRWEQYLGAVTSTVNRPAMVWQIPLGNQWFATENNTDGHYQDNRAEYFFSHMSELQQAGVIGLLFGAGNGGSTVNNDGKADGITNPASFCTTDGVSSGQICNNHTSTVSDDDGGYLRMAAANYYKAPLPIGGGTPPPPPPPADTTPPPAPAVTSPTSAVTTRTTTFTVAGTAEAAALVRVWVDANNNGLRDAGEALASSTQLGPGATSWSVSVPLSIGYNYFVVTATDAAGNQSTARRVPRIRRR
ncbi:MAG: hypothetical protein JWP02_248 [Acidimicrobiales bacterium]|nr:hypothetical protein [Acidimicrobiales bacterium]